MIVKHQVIGNTKITINDGYIVPEKVDDILRRCAEIIAANERRKAERSLQNGEPNS